MTLRRQLLLLLLLLGGTMAYCQERSLVTAEKITAAEKAKYEAAWYAVAKAQDALKQTENDIAKAHNLKRESWMEWSTDVQISGDWILLWYSNHMQGFQFLNNQNQPAPAPEKP